MPDARCTRGPVCKMGRENAHEHTGSAENIRHSLRNGLTAYGELSPVIRFVCHRRPTNDGWPDARLGRLRLRELDANHEASGPHAFAVRSSTVRLACLVIAHG
jgi:hypothetical protein